MTFVSCLAKDFFDVIVVNRGDWTTRMRQVFYDLTTLTECFMSLKYFLLGRVDSPKTLLQHFQWFRSCNFIGNTKFQANSLFNFFFHSKYLQTDFSRRKPMAAKHILMDVSHSNFTRSSKKVLPTWTKNFFTVSVYARGLTVPVGVKFDQMVYSWTSYANASIRCYSQDLRRFKERKSFPVASVDLLKTPTKVQMPSLGLLRWKRYSAVKAWLILQLTSLLLHTITVSEDC